MEMWETSNVPIPYHPSKGPSLTGMEAATLKETHLVNYPSNSSIWKLYIETISLQKHIADRV